LKDIFQNSVGFGRYLPKSIDFWKISSKFDDFRKLSSVFRELPGTPPEAPQEPKNEGWRLKMYQKTRVGGSWGASGGVPGSSRNTEDTFQESVSLEDIFQNSTDFGRYLPKTRGF